MSWYTVPGVDQDVVLHTQVQIFRNIVGSPFPASLDAAASSDLIDKIGTVLEGNGFHRVDFSDVVTHLDLDTIIYPKNIASDQIVRYVRAMKNTIGSNVETLYNIIQGEVEASEFIVKKDSAIVGKPLSELQFKDNVLIAAILRGRKVIIPRGQDTIEPKDHVVIVSKLMALHDITDVLK